MTTKGLIINPNSPVYNDVHFRNWSLKTTNTMDDHFTIELVIIESIIDYIVYLVSHLLMENERYVYLLSEVLLSEVSCQLPIQRLSNCFYFF